MKGAAPSPKNKRERLLRPRGNHSLRRFGCSRLPDSLRKCIFFRPDAWEFFNFNVCLELEGYVAPFNGLGVGFRIYDRNIVEKSVVVDALVTLCDMHLLRVGIARRGEPGFFIEAG